LKRLILLFAAAILALGGGTQRLDAGFILPGTGNTFPADTDSLPPGSGVDGHVNFAVLNRSGAGLNDTWGTGLAGLLGFDSFFLKDDASAPLDTRAKYLYLFQTVNDGPNALEISANSVQVKAADVTSYGVFVGLGFTESGVLTAAGGPYLGGASAAAGDKSGTKVGGDPGVAANAAAKAQTNLFLTGSSLFAVYAFPLDLKTTFTSMIWGYTSNAEPFFGNTTIIDGGIGADGTVPVNFRTPGGPLVPEPASIAMFGLGVAGLFGYNLRSRKKGVA